MKISLKNVRLSFPDIWEPRAINAGDTPRFGATFLIDPKDPQVAEIRNAIKQVASEKWGAKAAAQLAAIEAAQKTCLHDGNTKAYDGYAGMLYVSAGAPEDKPPLVLGLDRRPLAKASGQPYAGCYVTAVIDIWAQDNAFGKRINAGLKGVQFARHGDAFSGSAPATVDDFEDLSEGAAAEELF